MAQANFNNRSKKSKSHTGHESMLNTFLRLGKSVTLELLNGQSITGRIKAYDKFTISLNLEGEAFNRIVFKSAVISFYSEEV